MEYKHHNPPSRKLEKEITEEETKTKVLASKRVNKGPKLETGTTHSNPRMCQFLHPRTGLVTFQGTPTLLSIGDLQEKFQEVTDKQIKQEI